MLLQLLILLNTDMLAVVDKLLGICKDFPKEKIVKTRSEINHQNYLKRKSKNLRTLNYSLKNLKKSLKALK